MMGLKDKSAIVTGGSKGIGFAIAKALTAEGVNTLLIARDEERLSVCCNELSGSGVQTDYLVGDVVDPRLPDIAVKYAKKKWGKVDILINNSGGPPMGGFLEFSSELWQASMEQNLLSTVRFSQAVAKDMMQNRWGRILSISSTVAKEPSASMVLSATARAGVAAFTKCISTELAPYGITANVICPGGVLTDRLTQLIKTRSDRDGIPFDSLLDQSVSSIPLGRFAQPSELGEVAAFLCSEGGAYITGVSLSVDGGLSKGFT